MSMPMKAAVRVVLLALVATLSFTSVGAATAAAPVTGEARAANACTVAGDVLAKRQANKKKLKKQRKVAKKRFNKAKKVRNRAKAKGQVKKFKKAKVRVKKTRKQFRKARNKVKRINVRIKNAKAGRTQACAPAKPGNRVLTPQEKAQAEGLGGVLALLTGILGGDGSPLSLEQLTSLLSELGLDALDPAILLALLDGFNGFDLDTLDPNQIADLLGGGFDPADLLDMLLGGDLDPTMLAGVLETVLGQLAGMGGLPLPEFTPEGLLGALGLVVHLLNENLLTQLGLESVGDLLVALLAGGSFDSLSEGQLEALAGIVDLLDPALLGQVTDLPVLGDLIATLALLGGAEAPGLGDLPILGPILCGLLPICR